jgi:N6-L-threonylcarbamoyladenine synthase
MEQSPGKGLILGIESSCDETAAAVVQRGAQALSNVVASQIALHAAFGGVVPELASREHLRSIVPVVRAAMEHANAGFDDLDGIAVTEGPGLAGALLVGILYAKALAFGLGKPLLAVNHLEGHIHAVLMEARSRGEAFQDFPLLALVVSGGHTHLFLAEAREGTWSYRNVGRTVDDAAGEAYDKVAKLLGLGYPGGPWMDALAAFGDPAAVRFNFGPIRSKEDGLRFDFSFSGIKTAVLRYVEMHGMKPGIEARRLALADGANLKPEQARDLCDGRTLDLIASFQAAVVGVLLRQALAAAQAFGVRGVLVSGGVAANRELRRRFEAEAAALGLPMAFPSIALSTDNAAMIAAAAWPKLQAGQIAPESMSAEPQLRLGT